MTPYRLKRREFLAEASRVDTGLVLWAPIRATEPLSFRVFAAELHLGQVFGQPSLAVLYVGSVQALANADPSGLRRLARQVAFRLSQHFVPIERHQGGKWE